MKVTLISNGFQPNYEKAFANGLARNGVEVELIGSDRTLYSELHASIRAINLRGSQDPRRSWLRKAVNLLAYVFGLHVYLFRNKPRVLHITGMLMGGVGWSAVPELLLYKLESRRLWLTVHNLVPHGMPKNKGVFVRRLIYAIPHLLVVHTSKMQRELMELYRVPGNRIIVMQHGVDEIPPNVPASSKNQEAGILKVLLFGGVVPYKGVDTFLEALRFCKGVRVKAVIAGEARDPDYATRIQKLIEAVPPPHEIVWQRGYVAEEALNALFANADVVAMPYRHIDQSGVLFTAYRFGRPVLCFDVGAFREYVPEFAGRVVAEQTPKAFAQALTEFQQEKKRYARDAILNYARSFAWEKTVQVLLPELSAA